MSVGAVLLGATALDVAAKVQEARVRAAEAKAEQHMAEYNAGVAEQQAEARRIKGAYDQRLVVAAGRRRYGTALAQMGAGGALPNDLVLAEINRQTEKERTLIEYETMMDISRLTSRAGLYQMEAGYAKMRRKAAGTAGLLGAGATGIGGYAAMRREGYTLRGTFGEIGGYGRSLLTGF